MIQNVSHLCDRKYLASEPFNDYPCTAVPHLTVIYIYNYYLNRQPLICIKEGNKDGTNKLKTT